MNKRQAKKKQKFEEYYLDVWGCVMSYAELKKMQRSYHENVVVQNDYRGITDYSDLEELSSILGIPYEIPQNNYNYPNRLRFHTIRKVDGFIRVLK